MVETRRLGKCVSFRVGIVVLVAVLALVWSGSVMPATQPEPAVDVESSVESIDSSASVIKYEELSDTQQEQFRDAVAGSGYITSEHQRVESYDYVYLDGGYYPTEVVDHYTETAGLLLAVSFIGFAVSIAIFVFSGVGIITGVLALVLTVVGIDAEQVDSWWDSVSSIVVGLIVVVGLVGLLVSPVVFNIQETSVVKYEDSPPEGLEVTDAAELSDAESSAFKVVAGGGSAVFKGDEPSEYEAIKSDGEYYVVKQSYPLSIDIVVIAGSGFLFLELLVLGGVFILIEGIRDDLLGAKNIFGTYS